MLDPNLAIINLATGEITPLDEWLRSYRQEQLQLILAQLGRGGGNGRLQSENSVDEAAQLLFAPRDGPQ